MKSSEIYQAMGKPLIKILSLVLSVLKETPPEIAADITSRHRLKWWGSRLAGMHQFLSQELGVPVLVAPNPELAVVTGAGKALHDRDKLGALIEGPERVYRRRF